MSEIRCNDSHAGQLLHAYELGLLDDTERQQFEIHLLGCEHCLSQIEKLHEHMTTMRTDSVVREAISAQCGGPVAGGNWLSRGWRWTWSSATVRIRPVVVGAMAILLFLGGYVLPGYLAKRTVESVQTITLASNRSANNETFVRSLGQDGLLSVIIEDAMPGRRFDLLVLDDRGRVLSRPSPVEATDSFLVCRLLFPSRLMSLGSYSVLVMSPTDGAGVDTLHYGFRVVD